MCSKFCANCKVKTRKKKEKKEEGDYWSNKNIFSPIITIISLKQTT